MGEETKEKQKSKFWFHDAIISWACMIWAVVSFVLMFYFSGLNQVTFAIMTFGQLFIIMGIIAITRGQPTGGIFTVTGIGCIVIPALNEWGYLFFGMQEPNVMFPIFATVAIILIGLSMLILPGVLEDSAKRRCKKNVKGEVVDTKTTTLRDGTVAYASIYQYSVNEELYTVCRNKYTVEQEPVGKIVDLKINENNPKDVYFAASKASIMLIYIFGMGFLITGIGMLLTVLAEIQ